MPFKIRRRAAPKNGPGRRGRQQRRDAAPALVASVLWVLVFLQYRESFNGIFRAKPVTHP